MMFSAMAALKQFLAPPYVHLLDKQLLHKLLSKTAATQRPLPDVTSETWDAERVLSGALQLPDNEELDMQVLMGKLVVLLLLSSGRRKCDLMKCAVDSKHMVRTPDSYYFALSAPSKGYRNTSHSYMQFIQFKKYPTVPKICPYAALDYYFTHLRGFRLPHHDLFAIIGGKRTPASPDTVRRWGVTFLKAVGVEPEKAVLCQTRAAHASISFNSGDSLESIMSRCAWARTSTFYQFYLKGVRDTPEAMKLTDARVQREFFTYRRDVQQKFNAPHSKSTPGHNLVRMLPDEFDVQLPLDHPVSTSDSTTETSDSIPQPPEKVDHVHIFPRSSTSPTSSDSGSPIPIPQKVPVVPSRGSSTRVPASEQLQPPCDQVPPPFQHQGELVIPQVLPQSLVRYDPFHAPSASNPGQLEVFIAKTPTFSEAQNASVGGLHTG